MGTDNGWQSPEGLKEVLMYYAGIGSRKTPRDILELMTKIGRSFYSKGWVLRSGGADGADSAFAADVPPDGKQIFLPWPGFNGVESDYCEPEAWTFPIAEKFHPRWDKLSQGAQKLHARNVHQVLGPDEYSAPHSALIICWTPSDNEGGTGQALRIARYYDIPIFNLGDPIKINELREFYAALSTNK